MFQMQYIYRFEAIVVTNTAKQNITNYLSYLFSSKSFMFTKSSQHRKKKTQALWFFSVQEANFGSGNETPLALRTKRRMGFQWDT